MAAYGALGGALLFGSFALFLPILRLVASFAPYDAVAPDWWAAVGSATAAGGCAGLAAATATALPLRSRPGTWRVLAVQQWALQAQPEVCAVPRNIVHGTHENICPCNRLL